MDDRSIARFVQRYVGLAGLDPAGFGGHSLRRGLLTAAARRRASIWKMQKLARYRSLDMLLDYVEPDDLFEEHTLAGVLGSDGAPQPAAEP
jgi:hypothetical protein